MVDKLYFSTINILASSNGYKIIDILR